MVNKYDLIPEKIIEKANNILDIGLGDNNNQLNSKYSKIFKSNKYLVIDIRKIKTDLNYHQTNILDFNTDKKFDLIICIEVIEHIKFSEWNNLFKKMKTLLSSNGYLLITTPYKQKLNEYLESIPEINAQIHNVFNIDKKILKHFLTNSEISIIYDSNFKTTNENYLWCILRHIKRIFTKHKSITKVIFSKRSNEQLFCLYKKES